MDPELRNETPSPFPQVRQPSVPSFEAAGPASEEDNDASEELEASGQWPNATVTPTTEEVAWRALRIGIQNRRSIGKPSIAATKQKSSGLFRVVENVDTKLDAVSVNVEKVAAAVATSSAVAERRVNYLSVFGEKVISALIPMILVGIFAYLTGHLHWSNATTTSPLPGVAPAIPPGGSPAQH